MKTLKVSTLQITCVVLALIVSVSGGVFIFAIGEPCAQQAIALATIGADAYAVKYAAQHIQVNGHIQTVDKPADLS